MQPVTELPVPVVRALRGVFTDIDDTLTEDGKLSAAAYAALWQLHDAGIAVVPVTGRPAGWCDLIARQWPVAGVIGENGALAFWQDGGRLYRLYHPSVERGEVRQRLAAIERAVLAEVPDSRVAADQPYRMFDLAIDFREDLPDLGFAAAERIREVFARHGAHAKVSSIHVNGWFGDYDKLAMVRLFCRARWQIELDFELGRYLFCGDSPNDEPMFAAFENSCAVANITNFAARMQHLPRYVTAACGGAGFAELVGELLAKRGEPPQKA